jgi:transcriptional antiterminator RfaH
MSFWAVARIAPNRENFVAERLESRGFEILAPKTRENSSRVVLLFPGYLFIRLNLTWQMVDRTIGVIGLIKCGDAPARCPEREIARIRRQMDPDGMVRLPKPPRRQRRIGEDVLITGGPFRGRLAIYAGMSPRERETVLLRLLGRQATIELKPGQLDPLAGAGDSALSHRRRNAGVDEGRQKPRRAERFS